MHNRDICSYSLKKFNLTDILNKYVFLTWLNMRTVFILQARVVYQRELEGSAQYLCCCLLWTSWMSFPESAGATRPVWESQLWVPQLSQDNFSSSSLSPLYFWSFSFSFFLTLSSLIATSITMAVCLRSCSYPTEEVVYSGFGGYDCQDKKFHDTTNETHFIPKYSRMTMTIEI